MQNLPKEGSGCLLTYDGEVLLLERNPEYKKNDKKKHEFEYPGGKINGSETYVECAIREVFEETGNTLVLDPEQFDDKKRVIVESPAKKGICLYVVEMTDEQFKMLYQIDANLRNSAEKHIEECETLSVRMVDIADLKADRLELPLRAFNKILLKKLIEEKMI